MIQMKEVSDADDPELYEDLFGEATPKPLSRQSSGATASQALLNTFAAPPSLQTGRYGSFNMITHATGHSNKSSVLEAPRKPWEDEHANLEDDSVRQLALEFNLGVLFGGCLSISVNMWLGIDHVISFGLFGACLCGAVMTLSKYITASVERERAQYEYEIERSHLSQFPNEERAELREDLLKKGLSEETVQAILDDLVSKKDIQAQLHTLMHLGIDPAAEETKCIYRQSCITAFGVPFGSIFSMFPFFFISDGFRASLGCLFLLGMLSLASGALLSLKAARSASFLAFRQMSLTVGAALFLFLISWIIKETSWIAENPHAEL